tara:strand:+ start:1563 stop:1925 length:363 start_codon:yes stop_codon:yes gene_type:complete
MADEFLKMDMEVKVEIDADWARFGSKLQNVIEIAARHIEQDAKDRLRNWPAVDTGATLNSTQSRKADTQGLVWRIGPTTEYAPFIEFGTERMRARAFMIPAAEREKPRVEKAITELFKDL